MQYSTVQCYAVQCPRVSVGVSVRCRADPPWNVKYCDGILATLAHTFHTYISEHFSKKSFEHYRNVENYHGILLATLSGSLCNYISVNVSDD